MLGASSQPRAATKFVTPRELQDWLTYYYIAPRERHTLAYLDAMERRGVLADPASSAPISAFLAEIFRRQSETTLPWAQALERKPESATTLLYGLWLAGHGELAQSLAMRWKQPDELTASFSIAPPDLRRMKLHDPKQLDVIWAAFAASGDDFYVRRLVRMLEKAARLGKEDAELVVDARKTLKKNMRLHARVREQVRQILASGGGEDPARLNELWLESFEHFQPFATRQNNFSAMIGVHNDPLFPRRWAVQPVGEVPRLAAEVIIKPNEEAFIELFVSGMQLDKEQYGHVQVALTVQGPDGTKVLEIAPMTWLKGTLPTPYRVYRLPESISFSSSTPWKEGEYAVTAQVFDREGGAELQLTSTILVIEPEADDIEDLQ